MEIREETEDVAAAVALVMLVLSERGALEIPVKMAVPEMLVERAHAAVEVEVWEPLEQSVELRGMV
jgi:hypothetical protein